MADGTAEESGAAPRPYGKLLVAALLASLVAVEVGLRLVDLRAGRDADFFAPPPTTHGLYEPHPYIGYVLQAGAGRDQGNYTFHINSLGFRGPEYAAEKPADVYRILCLGGSTTYGTGVSSDEATYPGQLEAMLNLVAAEGRKYEVWNCGVSGYNSAESLINLQLRLLQYDPDAIVIYHAANDARPIQARGFRPDYAHVRRSWVASEISGLERFLLRSWRTYAWLTRGTDSEEQLGALASYVFVPNFKDLHVPAGQAVPDRGVAAFLTNVRNMVAVARAAGVVPVLSTFATCSECQLPQDEDFLATVHRINQGLQALASDLDAPLIDVAARLSDLPEMYEDWMHFNDEGSRAHARVVVKAAKDAGLFEL
ncbi:MAG: GDSL-type esterase/lipase family protein [Planctomycetota bacterium]